MGGKQTKDKKPDAKSKGKEPAKTPEPVAALRTFEEVVRVLAVPTESNLHQILPLPRIGLEVTFAKEREESNSNANPPSASSSIEETRRGR